MVRGHTWISAFQANLGRADLSLAMGLKEDLLLVKPLRSSIHGLKIASEMKYT